MEGSIKYGKNKTHEKKNRKEIQLKAPAGIFDLFDGAITSSFNITEDEYDFIVENITDEELEVFVAALGGLDFAPTFTEKRKGLEVRNKYLEIYNQQKS